MEVSRLRVELELQLLSTATATQILSHVYDLHHRSRQHQILNPLSKARDQTQVLKLTSSWILVGFATVEPWKELPGKAVVLSHNNEAPRYTEIMQFTPEM